jgi:hypothetical protein
VPRLSSPAEVREYLRAFKRAATEGRKKTEIWDRTKNRDALPDLGLSERQRDDIILGLRVEPLRRAMCLSFHRAEHPMNFPFKS